MAFLRFVLPGFLLCSCLFADNPPAPPEEIALEKKEFAFEPWFMGPLVGGSAICLEPGIWDVQPYLSFGSFNKFYDTSGDLIPTSSISIVDFITLIDVGLISGFDLQVLLEELYSHVQHNSAYSFGDIHVFLGIQLHQEGQLWPAVRLVLREKFPTGKYEHLNPLMLDIDGYAGSGCFTTEIGLNISKVFHWFYHHPISWRINFNQEFGTSARVHDFNTYGGGFGTNGKITTPKIFSTIFSFEFAFTQHWAYAMDIWYKRYSHCRFSGTPGTDADGFPAINGSTFSQWIVLTPSLEYCISLTQGFIAGAYITVTGHNTYKLLNTILSYEILF